MKRLTEKMVLSGLVIAWRRATWPTRRSPVLGLTATTDGVRRLPSAFSRTVGSPASMIATTELVVPRSIPSTFAIRVHLAFLEHARVAVRAAPPKPRTLSVGTNPTLRAWQTLPAAGPELACGVSRGLMHGRARGRSA